MAIAVNFIFAAAAALGVYLGVLYLRRTPRPVLLGAIHLLLGVGGLELLSVVYRQTEPAPPRTEALLPAAGLFFAVAVFGGFTTPMIGRKWPASATPLLALHAVAGLAGLALLSAWVANW
jgi:uncharacterized membrane protein YfcA